MVCSRPKWCTFTSDGAIAHCMRVASDRPSSGGGWIHELTAMPRRKPPAARPLQLAPRREDLEQLSQRWIGNLTAARLEAFAEQLGVEPAGLTLLGIGWTGRAFSFPMRNARREIVGIRIRSFAGQKWSVRGGKEGVFVPSCALDGPLLFPEGPTDSAAAMGLGFDVVGRPSCTGATRICAELARGRAAVVVADSDEPGRRGAEALAAALQPYAATVRVIEPPAKDLREWIRGGAAADDVFGLIAAAPARRLVLRERRR